MTCQCIAPSCINGKCWGLAGARGLCEACQLVADLGGDCGLPETYQPPPAKVDYAKQDPEAVKEAIDKAAEEAIG